MHHFDYLTPTSLEEAVLTLERHGEEARVIAGGTDLVVDLKLGRKRPRFLVDLTNIPGLNAISQAPGRGMRVGALATLQNIARSPKVRESYPFLSAACLKMASRQVRSLATIGGNLCNASPAADTAPILLALDARVSIWGPRGERSLPLAEFFLGPRRTALAPGEILASVDLPDLPPGGRGIYCKHTVRRAMDLAIVGVALVGVPSGPRVWNLCRIGLGAVAPTPRRARRTEAILVGCELGEEVLQEAAHQVLEEIEPLSDLRASAEYRRDMVAVLLKRSVRHILETEAGQN